MSFSPERNFSIRQRHSLVAFTHPCHTPIFMGGVHDDIGRAALCAVLFDSRCRSWWSIIYSPATVPDRTGPYRTGPDRTRPDRTGPDWTGPDRRPNAPTPTRSPLSPGHERTSTASVDSDISLCGLSFCNLAPWQRRSRAEEGRRSAGGVGEFTRYHACP